MTFTIIYPEKGRGSFVTGSKLGGTLDTAGVLPGSYYRAPSKGAPAPGLIGAMAVKYGMSCQLNDYAVHRAVVSFQPYFHAKPDGILGPITNQLIRDQQKAHGLFVDGAIGPKTCRALFEPLVAAAVAKLNVTYSNWLYMATMGTAWHESGFDPGAVGITTPKDRGIAQINAAHHPSVSVNDCFNPAFAIPWMVDFIHDNLRAMNYDEDAGIIAYNLGVRGTWLWTEAGRPQWYRGTDTKSYIANVRKAQ